MTGAVRVAAVAVVASLAACGAPSPERVTALEVDNYGLAATADHVYVVAVDRTLYEVPVDGGAPRALATATADTCGIVEQIAIDGGDVVWSATDGIVRRIDLATGDVESTELGCRRLVDVADGVAYWRDADVLWGWPAGAEPAPVLTELPFGYGRIADGWMYMFAGDRLMRYSLDGVTRDLRLQIPDGWGATRLRVAGGFLYWEETLDQRLRGATQRAPVDSEDESFEAVGTIEWSGFETIIDEAGVFSGTWRLAPGEATAERFLPIDGEHGAVENIAIGGDHLYWVAREGGVKHVYRADKFGEPVEGAAP